MKQRIPIISLLLLLIMFSIGQIGLFDKSAGSKIPEGFISFGMGNNIIVFGPPEALAAGTADYSCAGTSCDVAFQAALDALPANGGMIHVLAPATAYDFDVTVTRAIDNVTIDGEGMSSYFTLDGATAIFTAGGDNWVFQHIRTDAGGLDMGATTGYMRINVLEGATYYGLHGEALNIGAFTLDGKLTAGANEIEGSNFDINGGDISSATISGGLTWNAAQDMNNQALTNINVDSGNIGPFTLTGKITGGASEFEGSNFDINGADISVATISGGLTWNAAQDMNSQALTNINIDSGVISGVTLSGNLSNVLYVGENAIQLDPSLSADGTYSGIIDQGVYGDTLVFGDLIYRAVSDQRWELTDADSVHLSGNVDIAMALESGSDGQTKLILLTGKIREDDWNFTGYGAPLFVSTTAGDMTQTAPSGAADIVRIVGYAGDNADSIRFNPDRGWLEIP